MLKTHQTHIFTKKNLKLVDYNFSFYKKKLISNNLCFNFYLDKKINF